MGTLSIPALLEAILEATATKTSAETRIAGIRTVLDQAARARYAEEGAAPSWKRRDLGNVRLDEPGEWKATVVDAAAFGSYVAQAYPTEATAVIRVPAALAEVALDALRFAGLGTEVETSTEVRGNFREKLLEGLVVDVEETRHDDGALDRTITVVDPATGVVVDGLSATRKEATLVVTLDRDRRAAVVAEAKAAAKALLDEDAPAAPPEPGRNRTIEDLVGTGLVKPASELTRPPAPELTAALEDEIVDAAQLDAEIASGAARPLSLEEAATVARFDAAPSALPPDAHTVNPNDAHAAAMAADVAAIEGLDNREALRRLAKARNVPAGGTKRELAERLYANGFRA